MLCRSFVIVLVALPSKKVPPPRKNFPTEVNFSGGGVVSVLKRPSSRSFTLINLSMKFSIFGDKTLKLSDMSPQLGLLTPPSPPPPTQPLQMELPVGTSCIWAARYLTFKMPRHFERKREHNKEDVAPLRCNVPIRHKSSIFCI